MDPKVIDDIVRRLQAPERQEQIRELARLSEERALRTLKGAQVPESLWRKVIDV